MPAILHADVTAVRIDSDNVELDLRVGPLGSSLPLAAAALLTAELEVECPFNVGYSTTAVTMAPEPFHGYYVVTFRVNTYDAPEVLEQLRESTFLTDFATTAQTHQGLLSTKTA